ncbi:MAG: hypothetical protein BGO68_00580 [Candidatus Amoebophilus sp. 36-38]|nr:MAG: hypothetical protein BGO68_00580 [Candidatus Amoebophilus sp. 36-38]
MQTYISILRGINVGVQKRIKMEVLKDLYESLNFKFVRIYLQTGNIIFQTQDIPPSNLVNEIENKLKEALGFNVPVLIKTNPELQQIIEDNPFKEEPTTVYVTCLFIDTSSETIVNEINKVKAPTEQYYISKTEIYLYCPNGYGRTKLSNNFFEKKLKVYATTRNLNTLNKLLDISKEISNHKA